MLERLPVLRVACVLGRAWNLAYLGREAEALALLEGEVRVLARQGWMGPALSGATLRYQRALLALRLGRRDLWRQVRRDARWLERRGLGWAAGLGAALRVGLARADRRPAAMPSLERAEELLAAAGMELHRAAARWRRGDWLGGERGAVLRGEAEAWLRAEGVAEPARLVATLMPG